MIDRRTLLRRGGLGAAGLSVAALVGVREAGGQSDPLDGLADWMAMVEGRIETIEAKLEAWDIPAPTATPTATPTPTLSPTATPSAGILLDPDSPIQPQLDAHPGATFLLAGTYRNFHNVIPRPGQTLEGVPEGAEIIGNGVWRSAIVGGEKGGDAHPGPVTLRTFALTGYQTNQGDGPWGPEGAIAAWLTDDWEFDRLTLYECLGNGEALRFGNRAWVHGCLIEDNAGMGANGHGEDYVFEDNSLYRNGGKDGGHEGGIKVVHSRRGVIRNNHAAENAGTGLWSDIDNIDNLIEGNLVEDNTTRGIATEIDFGTVIRDNTVRHNGLGFDVWLWGAQILVQNTMDAVVEGNEVTVSADGGDGIGVIEQSRGSSDRLGLEYLARNYRFRNNLVTFEGNRGQLGIVSDQGTGVEVRESGDWQGTTVRAPQSWWSRDQFEANGRFNVDEFEARTGWEITREVT